MAWLSGWAKRVKLTADNTDIDAALSDFPILLYLSTSSGRNAEDISFVFDELTADANRKKIAVTTSDGETQCYVEIEKWDDANEKAWLWVKAPSISNSADTDFYLYYDADHADNTAYVGDSGSRPEVWDSYFRAVFHMAEDPSGTAPQIINSVASKAVPVVATNTNEWLIGAPYNRNIWYANGRWWLFHVIFGSGVYYKSATTIQGLPYATGTLVTANCAGGFACGSVVRNTTLQYISRRTDNENLYYRMGTLNADGSISWTAAEQTIDVSAYGIVPIQDICITADSNGYAWVSWGHSTLASPVQGKVWVIKNANNNGTWSTDATVGVKQIGPEYTGTGQPCWPTLVPLTSGKMYAIAHSGGSAGGIYYATGDLWNGSAWLGSQEQATLDQTYGASISAVGVGDDVHLTYGAWGTGFNDYGPTYHRKRTYGVGWGSETEIKTISPSQACLGKDSSDDLYCFWMNGAYGQTPALTDIYYKKCTSGSWGSAVNWHTTRESVGSMHIGIATCSYAEQNGSLVLCYITGDQYNAERYGKLWVADVLSSGYLNAPYATSGGTMLTEDLVDGKIGKALDFDGSNDYLYAQDSPDMGDADFTLEAWGARASSGTTDHIFAKVMAASKRHYMLDFYTDKLYGGIAENSPTIAANWPVSTSTITDTAWHHLACSFDRSGNAQVYIDGAANGSPLAITANDDTIDTDAYMIIGNRGYGKTLPPSEAMWFHGKLDELRISRTLRSAAWLKATYEAGRDHLLDWGSEETSGETHEASATLSGAGTLSSVGKLIRNASATLAGEGGVAAVGKLIKSAAATLTGVATLTVVAALILTSSAAMTGEGTLAATAITNSSAPTILDATNVGQTSARLNAQVADDGGESCEGRFRWRGEDTEILRPNAAGDETALYWNDGTPHTPDPDYNWQMVDEEISDEDSTYVYWQSSSAWVQDLYNLPASGIPDGATINFIKVCVRAKVHGTSPVQTNLKILCKTHATIYESDEVTLPVGTYTLFSKQWTLNPYTNLAFTQSELEDLQIGLALRPPKTSPIYWIAEATQVYVEVNYTPIDWATTEWQNGLETNDPFYADLVNLDEDTEYEFQAQLRNSAGESAWSDSKLFTTSAVLEGAAALQGVGTLSASAKVTLAASASLQGEGTLAAASVLYRPGAASLAGQGTLAASGKVTTAGSASLTGEGTLSGSAELTKSGAATLQGQGSLAAAAKLTRTGAASLEGTGTLAASAQLLRRGAAVLQGEGQVTAAGKVTRTGAASLGGIGTLTASAQLLRAGAASLSGEGTLSASPNLTMAASASLEGIGTLTAEGTIIGAPIEGAASLSGIGTLQATAGLILPTAASLDGVGTLEAAAQVTRSASAALEGVGTLAVTGSVTRTGAAVLAGEGTLTATADVIAGAIEGAAVLSGQGTLTATAALTRTASATLIGEGQMVVAASVLREGRALFMYVLTRPCWDMSVETRPCWDMSVETRPCWDMSVETRETKST